MSGIVPAGIWSCVAMLWGLWCSCLWVCCSRPSTLHLRRLQRSSTLHFRRLQMSWCFLGESAVTRVFAASTRWRPAPTNPPASVRIRRRLRSTTSCSSRTVPAWSVAFSRALSLPRSPSFLFLHSRLSPLSLSLCSRAPIPEAATAGDAGEIVALEG